MGWSFAAVALLVGWTALLGWGLAAGAGMLSLAISAFYSVCFRGDGGKVIKVFTVTLAVLTAIAIGVFNRGTDDAPGDDPPRLCGKVQC